jgi:hypothetical protein
MPILKNQQLSLPRIFLHIEGASIFLFSIVVYYYISGNWLLFILLLLAPDIFMIGYLKDPNLGSIVYNIGHIYLWPGLIVLLGLFLNNFLLIQIGIIWLAHIGMDRMTGYGLKYPTKFKDTHFKKL